MATLETPELDRQLALVRSGKTGTVQDFIDWLGTRGMAVCRLKDTGLRNGANERVKEYVPVFDFEQLMADHFGIDRTKIETERRALLAVLREEN